MLDRVLKLHHSLLTQKNHKHNKKYNWYYVCVCIMHVKCI